MDDVLEIGLYRPAVLDLILINGGQQAFEVSYRPVRIGCQCGAGEPCACNRSPDINAGIEEPDSSRIALSRAATSAIDATTATNSRTAHHEGDSARPACRLSPACWLR